MTKNSKYIDWEAIEREYRAGQLSIREIARQHKISNPAIIGRAKRGGWVRDLSARVRGQIRAALISDLSGDASGANARDTVDAAAARGVELVRSHRAHLKALWETIATVRQQLGVHLSGKRGRVKVFEASGDGVASLLRTLSAATAQVIPLERQAFNLDEPTIGVDNRTKEERDAIASAAARADT